MYKNHNVLLRSFGILAIFLTLACTEKSSPSNPLKGEFSIDPAFDAILHTAAYSESAGTRCDGKHVASGAPGQLECGTNLKVWQCTQYGWVMNGASCVCGQPLQPVQPGNYTCSSGTRCDGTKVVS